MATSNVELEILKQLFGTLNNDDKTSFLKSIKSKKKSERKFIFTKEIKECPHCKSTSFMKNGKSGNSQRFICKDCCKTFTTSNNTILFGTKKDTATWKLFIYCLVEKYSIRKTAQICNINTRTAFNWRHKILDALQDMQDSVKLDGMVEADKTFVLKGNHKDFNFPRSAKYSGTANTKRGLSKELVCIPCVVHPNDKSVDKMANLGKPNTVSIYKIIQGGVEREVVFVTDSLRSYLKFSKKMSLNHFRIPRNKHINGCFNIQAVNNYHGQFKSMLSYNFKSVSTRYLNNYLVYHNFVSFAKETRFGKKQILFKYILETNYLIKSASVVSRPAIPLLVV